MAHARRTVVDINRGGTGKTTILMCMAWLDAIIAGERVLIQDNDTNAGQTFLSLGTNFDAHAYGKQDIYDVLTNLEGGISNAVFSLDMSAAITAREQISHLIPSRLLASASRFHRYHCRNPPARAKRRSVSANTASRWGDSPSRLIGS